MKIMITTRGDFVSPRFDMSSEALIATCYEGQLLEEPHSILVLWNVSAGWICDLALKENIDVVICGGIEEQHYQFLIWKKITVFDFPLSALMRSVLQLAMDNTLEPGTILPGVNSREKVA